MDNKEIKVLRACKSWTQAKLAAELGVKQPFIAQLEKEGRPVPAAIDKKLHAIQDTISEEEWSNKALKFLLKVAIEPPVGRLNKAVAWANPNEIRQAAIEVLSKLEEIERK